MKKLFTFGLADHDVAVLAFPALVETLHLDVIGGLWHEVDDGVPVVITLNRKRNKQCVNILASARHRTEQSEPFSTTKSFKN